VYLVSHTDKYRLIWYVTWIFRGD